MSRGNAAIREAVLDDMSAFLGFVEELRRTSGRGSYPRPPGATTVDGELSARFAELVANPRWQVLFAVDTDTGEQLGMAILTLDEISALTGSPVVHLSHLVVDARHRRRGIGRLLMASAVGYAERQSCEHLIVGVTTGGRDAHRFFARLGFAPLVSRRIASLSTLRRTVGVTDHGVDAQVLRRRALRPVRVLTRPLPMQRLRRGGAA